MVMIGCSIVIIIHGFFIAKGPLNVFQVTKERDRLDFFKFVKKIKFRRTCLSITLDYNIMFEKKLVLIWIPPFGWRQFLPLSVSSSCLCRCSAASKTLSSATSAWTRRNKSKSKLNTNRFYYSKWQPYVYFWLGHFSKFVTFS